MAVYKRSYHGYSGPLTPAWSRFLVLTRYASASLSGSRILTGLFIACLLPSVVTAVMIYLNHSSSLLSLFKIPGGHLLDINNRFFKNYLGVEVGFAFILTAVIGPGLVSPDLTNNALVLYFCRPLSRAEYVLGKLTVLARLLSFITWIPGLILFGIEASQSGWRWLWDNLYIAGALLAGSWILIAVLSLLALAASAWVKWKPAAGAIILGVLFLGAAFGAAFNAIMRTQVGNLFSIPALLKIVWNSLFRTASDVDFPPGLAWLGLLAFAAACLYLLSRKLRAYEVVR